MKNAPKQLSELLNQFTDSHPSLQSLINQSNALNNLGGVLKNILPPHVRPHVRAAHFKEGTLTLQISSAAWQLHLNYMREEIITTLRQSVLPNLVSINFNINPDILTLNNQSVELNTFTLKKPIVLQLKNPRKLSLETSKLLLELANNSSDDKLANALKKLAFHAMKK